MSHLDDFHSAPYTHDGDTYDVFRAGDGPAVLVLPEIPGVTPDVVRFGRWVCDVGLTAWIPSLFGRPGQHPTTAAAVESMDSFCVRREFEAFASGRASPLSGWLRSLARHAHVQCGGPGVGVIGMCFTGSFALAMAIDPTVVAPVMAQPSLPLDDPAGTFIRDDDLGSVAERLRDDNVIVPAYRFQGDPYCRVERFETLSRALGDRFRPTVLPDSAAGELGWIGEPHSVVTTSLIDADGEPTAAVRDEILTFFVERLGIQAGP